MKKREDQLCEHLMFNFNFERKNYQLIRETFTLSWLRARPKLFLPVFMLSPHTFGVTWHSFNAVLVVRFHQVFIFPP